MTIPVLGYTTQSEENIDAVNANKVMEEHILRMLDRMKQNPAYEQRWIDLGRDHIEQGFMAINRAIFKPKRVSVLDTGNYMATSDSDFNAE